ncbi:MAG: hypothetical protein HUJ75_03530, partial [Parasporobacterium sp.]|nr:hypothetical protein [Parasporobacterium sp.]
MQEEREATISLVEILAYLVRSLKLVIILMIICAIALGGFKVYSEISRIKNEEIRAYEVIDIDQYKDRLETLVLDRNQKVDYANNSLYLHLDPYNVSVTTVIMRVAVPEMTYTEGYPKSDDTRIEEIVNRIVANWDSLDLAVTLELPSYQGVESKFIKEMITVSGQDDMIIITGMGDTSERSQELTDAAYKYINDNKNTILAGKESCTISVISTETKTDINKDVLTAQNNYNTEMTNTDKAIDDLKKKVDELQSTIDSGKAKVKDDNISIVSIIKQAIIGAVVGLVLACIIVFCRFVFGKKVGASKVLEENSGLSY